MKAPLNTTVQLLRHFGPGWLMFRLGYAFRQRSGVLRRTLPATSWDEQPLSSFVSDPGLVKPQAFIEHRHRTGRNFFFDPASRESCRDVFAGWGASGLGPVEIANDIEAGLFRYFEHLPINVGCPPDWHHNPITGDRYPSDRHWTTIGDFCAGDIKLVWEPNRFAWVYPLVRAYWRTGDERCPRLFWQLVEDWRAANPPQQGVNWKCGQEVAIRSLACCFGLYGFERSRETTPERVADLSQTLAVSATRIEGNLAYALSQQNNHGITEAVGLWTIGLLFPEFASANRWVRIAQQAIEQQTRALIDDDGAFSQHSVNYQRVMLDACVWAIRLGQQNRQPLSDEVTERVHRAGEFLWQLQDESSGRLPRYGQNDGALLLPLTNCRPSDYRPVIQACVRLKSERRYAKGPWDEQTWWLFGTQEELQPNGNDERPIELRRSDWYASAGGYQVLRAEQGQLITRTPHYRHRPAHADTLHADIWWRGINIALDPGTYSYNAPEPWNNPLAGTAYHNTVMVDERDQMDRAGRFLWLPWLTGRRIACETSPDRELTYWEGTHNGYERLASPVAHQRSILRIGAEHWLILDALRSRQSHDYRLHWLLPDYPYVVDEESARLTLATEQGEYSLVAGSDRRDCRMSLVRADDASPRGWQAPNYGDRQPALSLALEVDTREVLFATLLGPDARAVQATSQQVTAEIGPKTYRIALLSECATASLTRIDLIQTASAD